MVSRTPTTAATAVSSQSKLSFSMKRTAKEAEINIPEPTSQKRQKTVPSEKKGELPTSTTPLTDLKSLLRSYTLKEAKPALFDKISDEYLNRTLLYTRGPSGSH